MVVNARCGECDGQALDRIGILFDGRTRHEIANRQADVPDGDGFAERAHDGCVQRDGTGEGEVGDGSDRIAFQQFRKGRIGFVEFRFVHLDGRGPFAAGAGEVRTDTPRRVGECDSYPARESGAVPPAPAEVHPYITGQAERGELLRDKPLDDRRYDGRQ